MDNEEGKKRVLFIHGYEGSPQGAKAKAMEKKFIVRTPDMGITKYRKDIQVEIIKFAMKYFLGVLILLYAVHSTNTNRLVIETIIFFTGIAIFYFVYKWKRKKASIKLVDRCINLQRANILEFKPDIVVGSSFGGAIALLLMQKRMWSGPTLLIAPAHELVTRATTLDLYPLGFRIPEKTRVHIVHGSSDVVVDIRSSKRLSLTGTPDFITFEVVDDDHALSHTVSAVSMSRFILRCFE